MSQLCSHAVCKKYHIWNHILMFMLQFLFTVDCCIYSMYLLWPLLRYNRGKSVVVWLHPASHLYSLHMFTHTQSYKSDMIQSLSLTHTLIHTHSQSETGRGWVSCFLRCIPQAVAWCLDVKRSQFAAAPRWVLSCRLTASGPYWEKYGEISHFHLLSTTYCVPCQLCTHTHTQVVLDKSNRCCRATAQDETVSVKMCD